MKESTRGAGGEAESFDAKAANWDDAPHRVERARQAAEQIAASVPIDRSTRLLDYGAGTGLLAQHLIGRAGSVVLAEPSQGMRDVLAMKVEAGILPGATILDLDLAVSRPPEQMAFDLIVSLMVIHHVDDIPTVLTRMRSLLPVGGHLCIVDLEEEDGSFHSPSFRGYHGLARDMLAQACITSGFVEPTFEHAFTMRKHDRDYELFLATAMAI